MKVDFSRFFILFYIFIKFSEKDVLRYALKKNKRFNNLVLAQPKKKMVSYVGFAAEIGGTSCNPVLLLLILLSIQFFYIKCWGFNS